MESPETKQL